MAKESDEIYLNARRLFRGSAIGVVRFLAGIERSGGESGMKKIVRFEKLVLSLSS